SPRVRQPVSLRVEQLVEQVEAARLSHAAVEDADVLLEVAAHRRARGAEGRHPPLDHFLLAPALLLLVRILLAPRRHVLQLEEDALQLVERLAAADLPLQLLDPVAEDLPVRARVDGEEVIEMT